MKGKRIFFAGLLTALLVVVLDQASKWLVVAKIMDPPRTLEILPVFDLVLVFNRGISFGMMAQESIKGVWFLLALSGGITLFMLGWLWRVGNIYPAVSIGFVIGGAIGNLIDRFRLGAVVDFLHFHWDQYSFPAFNVADSFITIGAVLMFLESFLSSNGSMKK